MSTGPRVLYLGVPCAFSAGPLAALLASEIVVAAVVVPDPAALRSGPRVVEPPEIPVLAPDEAPGIVELAWRQRVPVLAVGRLADPATISALAAYRPDAVTVACFPRRLPPALLTLPRLGCLNVHPGLLPANRGPAPLFWTFARGERQTGVTVHLMDERLDSGDILMQQDVDVPEGIAGRELERRCSSLGGYLLVAAVRALAAGTSVRVPQRHEASSYFSYPRAEDCSITPDRSAGWGFSFVRGVADLGYQVTAEVAGTRFAVRSAIGHDPDGQLGVPFVREGEVLWLQCTPGVLQLRVGSAMDG